MANDSSSNILKNTGLISLCTLASRVTGLLRTWAMAFALGNTLLTSAYQIANNLPNMVYELCAGGILGTAVFVPLYLMEKEKHGTEAAHRFSNNLMTLTLIFLGVLSLLCIVFAPWAIETQAFTIGDGQTKDLAIFFFRIFAIQILFYGLNAVVMGILNAERRFLASALTPILNNIIVIVTMFGFVPISAWNADVAMWWLGIGTTLGVLVQLLGQIPSLLKGNFHFRPLVDLHDPMLKEALKLAAPMFLYVAGNMITVSCQNAFALNAADNGPSTLAYARMWWQLPYGVIAVSLSTTLLTELSDCAARTDWEGFRGYVNKGLRSTLFMMVPLAALMCALAYPLIQLFRAGAFTSNDVSFVGNVLAFWTVSLPFYAGYMYFYKVFAAMRQFTLFAIIDVCMRLVQCFLYSQFCDPNFMGLVGIPMADIFFYGAMFLICSVLVKRKVGQFGFGGVLVLLLKAAIASVIGALIAFGFVLFGEAALVVIPVPTVVSALVIVIFSGCIGLAIILGLCKLLRIPEVTELTGLIKRLTSKLRRRSA